MFRAINATAIQVTPVATRAVRWRTAGATATPHRQQRGYQKRHRTTAQCISSIVCSPKMHATAAAASDCPDDVMTSERWDVTA